MKRFVLFLVFLSSYIANALYAGSATWSLNPSSSDWNTPDNWSPPTVPDGPSDIATFASSSQTLIEIPTATEVDSIVFQLGAGAFTIAQQFGDFGDNSFTFSGEGVVNDSGVIQTLVASAIPNGTEFFFYNSASAGALTSFRLETSDTSATALEFRDSSSAASATVLNEGGGQISGGGSGTLFFDSSTAANATITASGAPRSAAGAAVIAFADFSTADHALLIANGTRVNGTFGGAIGFNGSADAGAATIVANGSAAGQGAADVAAVDARAGSVSFTGTSSGGTAQLELLGNGFLDISGHTRSGMEVGSIEGQGSVLLNKNNLAVGTNNLSTTFSGRILQTGNPRIGGSINKVGTGTWTLSGANTYTAGTIVSQGFLKVSNTTGSATGSGAVQVDGGTLGGGGIIAGAVTVGTGNGPGAFLAPGTGSTTLTLQSSLTFKGNGTYTWRFTTRSGKADKVVANGVTIESGGQFQAVAKGNAQLTIGTSFTAINNKAATPVSGTFNNLPDGSTVTVGNNKFQADYQGGDGNDLTLTVVP